MLQIFLQKIKEKLRMGKYLLLCFLLFQFNIYPQLFINEPAPLKPGNYWMYSDYSGGKFSYRVFDSTAVIDSNLYYLVEYKYPNGPKLERYYQYNRLDTNNFYIRYNDNSFSNLEVKYFKKDAKLNESWTNIFSGYKRTAYYRIIDTGTTVWNGNYTKVKLLEVTDSALVDQWQYWSDDFGLLQVMDFEGASNYLVACVINGKVYGDTTFTDVKEIKNNIPSEFHLFQNYPNPFNPSTKINFDIPNTSFVTLKVYDITGKEIKTLINEEMRPGSYSADFNGNGLSSGIYIYVLKTPKCLAANKMTLLK